MLPRLLEFATIPNYRPRGIEIPNSTFLIGGRFIRTAKPYLEVMYTKFPVLMQPHIEDIGATGLSLGS